MGRSVRERRLGDDGGCRPVGGLRPSTVGVVVVAAARARVAGEAHAAAPVMRCRGFDGRRHRGRGSRRAAVASTAMRSESASSSSRSSLTSSTAVPASRAIEQQLTGALGGEDVEPAGRVGDDEHRRGLAEASASRTRWMLPPESWSSRRRRSASLRPAARPRSCSCGRLPFASKRACRLAAGRRPQRGVLSDGRARARRTRASGSAGTDTTPASTERPRSPVGTTLPSMQDLALVGATTPRPGRPAHADRCRPRRRRRGSRRGRGRGRCPAGPLPSPAAPTVGGPRASRSGSVATPLPGVLVASRGDRSRRPSPGRARRR